MIDSIGGSGMSLQSMTATRRASPMEKWDEDNSGALSSSEIDGLLSDISEKTGKTMSREDFLATLDKDGNGEINAGELKGMRNVLGPLPKGGPGGPGGSPPSDEKIFKKIDEDGSGSVSESELGALLSDISEKSGRTLDVSEILGELDANGDGELSSAEMKGLKEIVGPLPKQQGEFAMQSGIQMSEVSSMYTNSLFMQSDEDARTLTEI